MIIPGGGGSMRPGVASAGSIGVVCAVLYPSMELAWPCESPEDETDGIDVRGAGARSVGAEDLLDG